TRRVSTCRRGLQRLLQTVTRRSREKLITGHACLFFPPAGIIILQGLASPEKAQIQAGVCRLPEGGLCKSYTALLARSSAIRKSFPIPIVTGRITVRSVKPDGGPVQLVAAGIYRTPELLGARQGLLVGSGAKIAYQSIRSERICSMLFLLREGFSLSKRDGRDCWCWIRE